jgi:hypothetical protein
LSLPPLPSYHIIIMLENIMLEKRLRNISRRLTQFDLQRPDLETKELTTLDIEQYLSGKSRVNDLFLNYYSRQGLLDALERYGTTERLRKRGFDPFLNLKSRDQQHRLKISDGKKGPILIEMVGRFASLKSRRTINGINSGDVVELLTIEWLLLQNPREHFNEKRPRLPGQLYPGLGIGREIMALLKIMTERLQQEGMMAFPEHYHNGMLYDRELLFFSPEREGELKALERDLQDLSLAQASWAIETGLVIDNETGNPYKWRGEEMIWPLSKRLKDYFNSEEYSSKTEQVMANKKFSFDLEQLERVMKKVISEQSGK